MGECISKFTKGYVEGDEDSVIIRRPVPVQSHKNIEQLQIQNSKQNPKKFINSNSHSPECFKNEKMLLNNYDEKDSPKQKLDFFLQNQNQNLHQNINSNGFGGEMQDKTKIQEKILSENSLILNQQRSGFGQKILQRRDSKGAAKQSTNNLIKSIQKSQAINTSNFNMTENQLYLEEIIFQNEGLLNSERKQQQIPQQKNLKIKVQEYQEEDSCQISNNNLKLCYSPKTPFDKYNTYFSPIRDRKRTQAQQQSNQQEEGYDKIITQMDGQQGDQVAEESSKNMEKICFFSNGENPLITNLQHQNQNSVFQKQNDSDSLESDQDDNSKGMREHVFS